LSQAAVVPTGERIANYLQEVMSSACEVVTARSPGDIFSPKEPFRLAFNYDPEAQVIDVYVTGKLEKAEDIKTIFDFSQKLVLSLNDKVQKFYGVTLKATDLSMDYLNVTNGKVMMKLVNGKYTDKTMDTEVAKPTASTAEKN